MVMILDGQGHEMSCQRTVLMHARCQASPPSLSTPRTKAAATPDSNSELLRSSSGLAALRWARCYTRI